MNQVINKINKMCIQYGNQQKVAKIIGISTAYLNDIIHERRKISDKVASKLGFKWKLIQIKEEKHE